jgi:hypothetical protein
VVTSSLEFSFGHDCGEHVYYIFGHRGPPKSEEEAHDSFAIQDRLVRCFNVELERQACAGPSDPIAKPPQFLHALISQPALLLCSVQSEED